ncbi:MAG TPA: HDOD domain-containing protein [Pseudomonadales bacterium]|nr:HDOD domain-containing protein [Pseudomonadales bacterium]
MIALRLKQFLDEQAVSYRLIEQPQGRSMEEVARLALIDPVLVARAELFFDGTTLLMVVSPLTYQIDMQRLDRLVGRPLTALSPRNSERFFPDCEPGCYPALGASYGLPVVMDAFLARFPKVYIATGHHTGLIELEGDQFRRLHGAVLEGDFTLKPARVAPEPTESEAAPIDHERLKRKIERSGRLPAMPDLALRILQLVRDPEFSTAELGRLVAQDPAISAQVMKTASASAYAYQGKINSIDVAIVRVLGYRMVTHIAVGMAVSRSFRIPEEGPLGLKRFWLRAIFCATACQMIAQRLPKTLGVDAGLAYLTGLLHQFGLLMLGHLFLPELRMLGKLAEVSPEEPLHQLERRILSEGLGADALRLGHARLGAWMLRLWNMPAELQAVVAHYEARDYAGEHALYHATLLLATDMFSAHLLGHEQLGPASTAPLARLGLSSQQINDIHSSMLDQITLIEELGAALAA